MVIVEPFIYCTTDCLGIGLPLLTDYLCVRLLTLTYSLLICNGYNVDPMSTPHIIIRPIFYTQTQAHYRCCAVVTELSALDGVEVSKTEQQVARLMLLPVTTSMSPKT